jgi:hypothetical protein
MLASWRERESPLEAGEADVNPSLANDAASSTPAATLQANLRQIGAAKSTGDVILMTFPPKCQPASIPMRSTRVATAIGTVAR